MCKCIYLFFDEKKLQKYIMDRVHLSAKSPELILKPF